MKSAKKIVFALVFCIFQISLFANTTENTLFDRKDVNSFDRLIMNPYSKTLDVTGTMFAGATLATPLVLLGAEKEDYWKIGLEYAQTMVLAYGAKSIAKHAVDRARPYMYFKGAPQNEIEDGDWENSFFSGHSTLSFAAAGFTTFMFCEYFPESQWKVPVICGAYSLAVATGILRMASGNHFMSDVLVGAAVGSAIGYLVPFVNSFWFKPTFANDTNIVLTPVGFNLQWKF